MFSLRGLVGSSWDKTTFHGTLVGGAWDITAHTGAKVVKFTLYNLITELNVHFEGSDCQSLGHNQYGWRCFVWSHSYGDRDNI